jgi:hypothetical protein
MQAFIGAHRLLNPTVYSLQESISESSRQNRNGLFLDNNKTPLLNYESACRFKSSKIKYRMLKIPKLF